MQTGFLVLVSHFAQAKRVTGGVEHCDVLISAAKLFCRSNSAQTLRELNRCLDIRNTKIKVNLFLLLSRFFRPNGRHIIIFLNKKKHDVIIAANSVMVVKKGLFPSKQIVIKITERLLICAVDCNCT